MELMSSLLLCALVAFLPQALGQSRKEFSFNNGYNDSVMIGRKISTIGKSIILHKTPQRPQASFQNDKVNDLQSIFLDPACRGCYICMERVITAHRQHSHMMNPHPYVSSENFQDNPNMISVSRRYKRKTTLNSTVKSKRSKSKRSKGVTLMKYNDKGKIYALKIKENNSILDTYNQTKTETSCQVYSVQKSYSCDSPEANSVLAVPRKKTSKKGKKGFGKRETKSVEPVKTVTPPVYLYDSKRNVDDSHVLEQNIMPSIEEMY